MCDGTLLPQDADDKQCDRLPNPEISLAKMLFREFEINVSPQHLKRFLLDEWDTIIKLAHRIHENPSHEAY